MIIWVDAHLSPSIATWITQTFSITALSLRDVGLIDILIIIIHENKFLSR